MKYVAKYGNDSQTGDSKRRSLKSVQPAITLQTANNPTIEVFDGEYKEILTLIAVNTIMNGHGKVVFADPSVNSTFISAGTRSIDLTNIEVHGFGILIDAGSNGGGRVSEWSDVRVIGNGATDIIYWNFRQDLADDKTNPLYLDSCLITGCNDLHMDIGSIARSTIRASTLRIERTEEQAVIKDSIIDIGEIEFIRATGTLPFINCLFSDTTTFTYNDGVNQVSQVDFLAFKTANTTHNWGFDLTGCQTEQSTNTHIDTLNNDFRLKPNSLAVNMSLEYAYVGKYGVGYTVAVVDSGWSSNNGYTLNGTSYEAAADASIESPVLDLGSNVIIKTVSGLIDNDWANGLLLNSVGNLSDSPIITGGNQSGLNVTLIEDEVYCSTYAEVVTNQRTFTSGSSFCFAANNGEVIEAVNGTGDVRQLLDDSGLRTVDARFWRDGEVAPSAYQKVHIDQSLLVDENGNTNASPSYTGVNPRHPNLRNIQFRVISTSNNVKS